MKKLYSHRCKKHPRDRNDNPKESMHELSYGVIWPNHVPDPTADDYDTDPDTDNVENSENEFCMEVHGTEEWVWDYENSEENNIQIVDGVATEPTDDDGTKDDKDSNKSGS